MSHVSVKPNSSDEFDVTDSLLNLAVSGVNQGIYKISATTFGNRTFSVGITDDTTTNATMYPLWVTANTGNLPAKVSSTKLSFNPSTGLLSTVGATLTGNLTLPATTGSTVGVYMSGANRFIHNYGSDNFFAGSLAGNFTTTADHNVGVGVSSLESVSSGQYNTAIGMNSLVFTTTGAKNLAAGYASLYTNVGGGNNVSLGFFAGFNSIGSRNIFLGVSSGAYETGSNSFYLNNIDQVNTAGDKAYSLMYGTFAGTAGTVAGNALTVNGALTAVTSTTSPIIYGGTAAGSSLSLVSTSGTGSNDAVYIKGGTNGGTTIASFFGAGTYAGNVGIGTVSPAKNLEVSSAGSTVLRITSASGYGGKLEFDATSAAIQGYDGAGVAANRYMYFSVGGSDKVAILNNGNVGIGTTTPTAGSRLDIDGGNLTFHTDNTYDIGVNGATRPRTGYFGTSVISPLFNATTGFQIGGAATTGTILRGNGTNYVASTMTYPDTITSGYIPYATGANALGSSAELTYGATAGFLTITKSQNATTAFTINNTTSGANAAGLAAFTYNTGSTYVGVGVLNPGFSPTGMFQADVGILYSQVTNGLNVGTSNATELKFWTNNTQQVKINAAGGTIILGANNLYMKSTGTSINYWKISVVNGALALTDTGAATVPTTQ